MLGSPIEVADLTRERIKVLPPIGGVISRRKAESGIQQGKTTCSHSI